MHPMAITTACSLWEQSLGDAEYLAALRTLILPLVKVRSNAPHGHYYSLFIVGAVSGGR
jgi:hypothetical protein